MARSLRTAQWRLPGTWVAGKEFVAFSFVVGPQVWEQWNEAVVFRMQITIGDESQDRGKRVSTMYCLLNKKWS